MGSIFKNGVEYPAGTSRAIDQSYDNTNSGIAAVTTQGAIDELSSNLVNEDGEQFIYGILDGKRGLYTDPSRGADSFIPFKSDLSTANEIISNMSNVLNGLTPHKSYLVNITAIANSNVVIAIENATNCELIRIFNRNYTNAISGRLAQSLNVLIVPTSDSVTFTISNVFDSNEYVSLSAIEI